MNNILIKIGQNTKSNVCHIFPEYECEEVQGDYLDHVRGSHHHLQKLYHDSCQTLSS